MDLQTNMGFETSNEIFFFFFGRGLFTCSVYSCLSVRNQTKAGLNKGRKQGKFVGVPSCSISAFLLEGLTGHLFHHDCDRCLSTLNGNRTVVSWVTQTGVSQLNPVPMLNRRPRQEEYSIPQHPGIFSSSVPRYPDPHMPMAHVSYLKWRNVYRHTLLDTYRFFKMPVGINALCKPPCCTAYKITTTICDRHPTGSQTPTVTATIPQVPRFSSIFSMTRQEAQIPRNHSTWSH